MLLPVSGKAARLGQSLRQAAELGGRRLPVYDTGSTPEGAAEAARRAVSEGASVLAGPLYATSTRAVLRAIPRDVPVLSLSNDATLGADGAFVMGVTPFQSTDRILRFSAQQGVQSVVMLAPESPIGARFAEASRRVAPGLDLRIGTSFVGARPGSDLSSELRAALDGRLPDAVYIPSADASLPVLAAAVDQTGTNIFGSTQWNGSAALATPALEGAYFSSPDPSSFAPIALKYRDRFDVEPGMVAALAHDAAALAAGVRKARGGARRALLSAKGHAGAMGGYRFAADGRAQRSLSVLQLQGGSPFLVSADA
jgi:ABC-type branched-subunit amino acid transport system substrate-binding protein